MICQEDNCNKKASFNLPNEKTGFYCKVHKKENMIDITRKKCLEENCYIRPNFNFQDKKVVFIVQNTKKKI